MATCVQSERNHMLQLNDIGCAIVFGTRAKSKINQRRAQSNSQSSRRKSQLIHASGNFLEDELKIRLNVSLCGLSGALV